MPAYHVERNVTINKPLTDICHYLKNLRHWPAWSPWLIIERDATITFKGEQGSVGSSYAWHGNLIGKGNLTLKAIDAEQLSLKLNFTKPFKSKANVSFVLKELSATKTLVTWKMDSKLPFFMAFMKKNITGLIGMDYDRGLTMLKSQLETGEVLSHLNMIGERPLERIYYVGLPMQCEVADIGESWQDGIQTIKKTLKNHVMLGSPFGLYHKLEIHSSKTKFTLCFPVDKQTLETLKLKKPFIKGSVAACDTFVAEHMGEYKYIGNAWSLAYSAAKTNKIKLKRKPIGMEIFLNDPSTTDIKDLRAEVVLFKK